MRFYMLINAIILSILLTTPPVVKAYNTEDSVALDQNKKELKGGHEKMTDWSYKIIGSPFKVNWQALRTGTRDEDFGDNPRSHFYNPATDKGMPIFQNAKERAVDWYKKAVKTYTNGGSTAFYELGHSLHLLQDMAAPSHANAASHIWQSQIAKNGYEWWVTQNWDDKIDPYLTNLQNGGWLAPIIGGSNGQPALLMYEHDPWKEIVSKVP